MNYLKNINLNKSFPLLTKNTDLLFFVNQINLTTWTPNTEFHYKKLFLSQLEKYTTLFNFSIQKVDKAIRKNSRNKGQK